MRFNTFSRKGYGRIYVDELANIERVKEIIYELDDYEHGYLPTDFIALFSEYPRVVYTHKFCDLDLDKLTAACWGAGIHIWCFDAHNEEYPEA